MLTIAALVGLPVGLAQRVSAETTIPEQTTALPIYRSSGSCPQSINVVTSSRLYEGGSETSVLLKTSAIAGTAKYMDSKAKVVIFGAPLKPQYASCVGWVDPAKNPSPLYNVWLQFGHVYFRFDLDTIKRERPDSEITYQKIVNGEPKLRYAVAD